MRSNHVQNILTVIYYDALYCVWDSNRLLFNIGWTGTRTLQEQLVSRFYRHETIIWVKFRNVNRVAYILPLNDN